MPASGCYRMRLDVLALTVAHVMVPDDISLELMGGA